VGAIGPFQILILAVVILILFGRGRISEMMGDFGKGITSFKKGMTEDDDAVARQPARIEGPLHDARPEAVESARASDQPHG